jgi:hypothetical protein
MTQTAPYFMVFASLWLGFQTVTTRTASSPIPIPTPHLTRDTRPVNLPSTIALEFGVDNSDSNPNTNPDSSPDRSPNSNQKNNPSSNPIKNPSKTLNRTPAGIPAEPLKNASGIFQGGPNSLVARAVGSAEGTRRPDGGKNPAYFGHRDPGNAKWNLGSFSYQHAARSPEDADQRQLRRLQTQDQMLQQKAAEQGLNLTLEERLNGLDLANQAPLAALDRGGYIDRLKEARDRGLRGSEAILTARVNSYREPSTNLWDAPGLGNNEASIRHDQARRMDAVGDAMAIAGH